LGVGSLLQGLFIVGLASAIVFLRAVPSFQTLSITFVAIVLEAFPFMLIGALVGGFVEVFIPRDRMIALLPPAKKRTIFMAAALGLLFPVCECAIVPVVRRLLRKGLPLGAGVAFLLGGPIVNPLVAASTAVAYNFAWPVVLERMILGYLAAISVGFLFDWLFSPQRALATAQRLPGNGSQDAVLCNSAGSDWAVLIKIRLAVRHAADDFLDIGRFLVIGAFLAGALQALIPRQVFITLGATPVLSILAMMGLAVALNLCSEADAFVAASFRALLPPPAQMAFMVLGPMLDVKLIMMLAGVFRKRAIAALAVLTFTVVFSAVFLKQLWLP
jgi:hypothetical protein